MSYSEGADELHFHLAPITWIIIATDLFSTIYTNLNRSSVMCFRCKPPVASAVLMAIEA